MVVHPHDLYIMVGPPNSGKGTQAHLIADELGFVHLSSGKAFRDAVESGTQLGCMARSCLEAGELAPDPLAIDLILDRLRELAVGGDTTILDGFPRSLQQAEELDRRLVEMGLRIRAVVSIEVSENELLRRAADRGRADDRPEVVSRRLGVYWDITSPLIDFYRQRGQLIQINGEQPVDAVTRDILAAVGARIR